MLSDLRSRYEEWKESRATRRIFAGPGAQEAIQTNRASLALVKEWIEESRYQNSVFLYGLPEYLRPHIDTPLDAQPTYSDLMVLLARRLQSPLRYLEIGVSVGKNLFQILRACPGAAAAALDIEEENPPLLTGLEARGTQSWNSKSSLRPAAYARRHVDPQSGTELLYVCADELEPESWLPLRGRKFNMIFSDALHEERALLYELDRILEHQLLDENQFVLLWDDLHSPLRGAYDHILRTLQRNYPGRRLTSHLLRINGWVGTAEAPHLVGVIACGVSV